MSTKPTQEVDNGGGLGFDVSSDYYKIVYNWIAQAVPYGDPEKDNVSRLEVSPKEIFMNQPGESSTVGITAVYADGATRNVTREANIDSNVPDVAAVDAAAEVKGARVGEATLLVR